MDFVNKEDVAGLEVSKDTGEVASTLNRGARSNTKVGAELVSDNVRHGRFPESRGAVEENVVESLTVAPFFNGVDCEF